MAIKYEANTNAILKKIYPIIENAIEKPSSKSNYKKLVNEFISDRVRFLYDTLPCDRIQCSELTMDKLFDILKINKKEIKGYIDETYYGKIDNFNPLAAKHEFTIVMLLILRYFVLEANKTKTSNIKITKECELALIHLSFSGKFYPSLHYRSFPTVTPVRHVMEYVVNNNLSNKFDLKIQGSIIGAVKSVASTWLETYFNRLKSLSDEDVVYLIQQLHSRIGSFIKNIATEYYDAYENKDLYIAYQSDSYNDDNFHLADNDILKVGKYTEKTINSLNSIGVDYRICKMCSTADITPNECKAVIESIVSNKENIFSIKELISLMISLYFSSGEKDLSDIKFITYTISPKPNAKQKEILKLKEIIETWLCESGTAYMRRRSRVATRNAYERCIRMYFALIIHNANK